MTYKEIYDIAVPERKRKEERFNLWTAYALRPFSIIFTAPLINTKVAPTTVTAWSCIFSIIGFFLMALNLGYWWCIAGWFAFYIWAILDCIDGNLARCTNQCSPMGDLWDTMGGYATMVLMYFGSGIAAFFDNNLIDLCDSYLYLIFGGATAIFSIFPRLVLHKKKSSNFADNSVKNISDKNKFGLSKILVMNLISPTGLLQLALLAAIVFHLLNVFIVGYMIVNFAMMCVSLHSLLKE